MYYFGARFYNPSTSIWLSVDPLVEKTMDAYGYCYQNPINLIDPTGMSPTGNENHPPNVIIYIANFDDISDLQKSSVKDGWRIIFAVDIVHGLNELNKEYGDNEINNLLLRSHGGYQGDLAIGGVELTDGDVAPKHVKFNNYGLSYYIGLKGDKEKLKEEGFSDKEIRNYEAFTLLSSKVVDNGNFIISGCQVGRNEVFTDKIVKSLSRNKKFNFYFNIGNGGISLVNENDSMKCNPPNCSINGDIRRYLLSKPAGTISDVIINNNSQKPISLVD